MDAEEQRMGLRPEEVGKAVIPFLLYRVLGRRYCMMVTCSPCSICWCSGTVVAGVTVSEQSASNISGWLVTRSP